MKTCSKCGESKPESEYSKHKKAPDGLASHCKACHSALCKAWYAVHSEERKASMRAYSMAYGSRTNGRVNGRVYDKVYHKAYREAHREQRKENTRAWREVHPGQRKAESKAYREAHSEQLKALSHARQALEVGADGCFSAQEWSDLKAIHSHTCLRCGRREPEVKLTADHVVPLARGGSNGIENRQPLCVSCNCSKGAKIVDYRPLNRLGTLKAANNPLSTQALPEAYTRTK